MKNLLQKFNTWRIARTDYSKGTLIGEYFNKQRNGTLPKSMPKEFDPSLLARALNSIIRFWVNHWQWILGLTIPSIIGVIGLYLLWLQLKIPK